MKNNLIFSVKAIKQKQLINGVLFSLQEIYGIEKKGAGTTTTTSASSTSNHQDKNALPSTLSNVVNGCNGHDGANTAGWTESTETTNTTVAPMTTSNDNLSATTTISTRTKRQEREREQAEREQELKGVECVICMSEIRDVIIMPCRHLCLCKMCATNLRVQSNNCPICRIPFIALLQIKLVKKKELKVDLPKLKIQDLNSNHNHNHHRVHGICHENNVVVMGDEQMEEVGDVCSSGPIVHVERTNVNGEIECDKPILVECENNCGDNVKSPLKLLMDSYECVTIYEVDYELF